MTTTETQPWDPLSAARVARPWLWAGLALLIFSLQGPDFVRSLRPRRTIGVDLFQDWASARNLLNGLPVYSSHRETIERYLGYRAGEVRIDIDVNAHPPTSILLVLPFARLDYPDAVVAWNMASLAAFALSLWIVARQLRVGFYRWSVFPLITVLLICSPFREQMTQGQLNLVLLLLLTGTWAADRSGRPWLAGALLGAVTAIKLFPGFVFIYFLIRRRWAVIVAGIASCVLLTALTVAVMGVDTFRGYIVDAMPQVQRLQSSWINVSIPGFWVRLFDPQNPLDRVQPLWRSPMLARLATWASGLLVVVVLGVVIRRARTRPEQDRAFGLTVTSMLLVSPITWHHYFLLLLLPVTLLWLALPSTGSARAVFLLLFCVLFLVNPLQLADAFVPGGYANGTAFPIHTLTVLSLQCYALIGLFVFCLVTSRDAAPERDHLPSGFPACR
jgi:alpha-1,2-mannosyltransferase